MIPDKSEISPLQTEANGRRSRSSTFNLTHDSVANYNKGYAPGSWSQVAIDRVSPGGRVVGIDIIPAQPPRGVSTIQGNFLSPAIQAEVRAYVQDHNRGRPRQQNTGGAASVEQEQEVDELDLGYLEMERHSSLETSAEASKAEAAPVGNEGKAEDANRSRRERDKAAGRVVDVVISDMCAPWEQTSGFSQRSVTEPYRRMMNTSGNSFKDHVGSMVSFPGLIQNDVKTC